LEGSEYFLISYNRHLLHLMEGVPEFRLRNPIRIGGRAGDARVLNDRLCEALEHHLNRSFLEQILDEGRAEAHPPILPDGV